MALSLSHGVPPPHPSFAPFPPPVGVINQRITPITFPGPTVRAGRFGGSPPRGPPSNPSTLNPAAARREMILIRVVFGKYANYGKVAAPFSTGAADISGAESGSIVLATGNWYAAYSTDGGNTFTPIDPTTVFDNTADGGFCCDQIVQYVPSIDRFIWLMQFNRGGDGKNRLRIAAASPETVSSSKCTSWTYWDLTSDALGVVTTAAEGAVPSNAKPGPIHWMDYPNMSVGNNYLYISIDNVGSGGASPPTGGRIIVRVPLSEIATGSTINFNYTDWAKAGLAYGSHVTQNTGDEAYWAGHRNNTTKVFNWNENSSSYSWRDVGVNGWPNGTNLRHDNGMLWRSPSSA